MLRGRLIKGEWIVDDDRPGSVCLPAKRSCRTAAALWGGLAPTWKAWPTLYDSQASWSTWWLILGKPGYQLPTADPVEACRPADTEMVGPCAVKRNPAIGPSLTELLN